MANPESVAWQLDGSFDGHILPAADGVGFDGYLKRCSLEPETVRQIAIAYECPSDVDSRRKSNPVREYLQCFYNCDSFTYYDKSRKAPGCDQHWLWVKAAQLFVDSKEKRNALSVAKSRYDGVFIDEVAAINSRGMLLKNCVDLRGKGPNFGFRDYKDQNSRPYWGVSFGEFTGRCIEPVLSRNLSVCVSFADPSGHFERDGVYSVPNHVKSDILSDDYMEVLENLCKAYSGAGLGVSLQLYNPASVSALARYLREVKRGAFDINKYTYLWFALRPDYPFLMKDFVEDPKQGKLQCTPSGAGFWTWGSSTRERRDLAYEWLSLWRGSETLSELSSFGEASFTTF